MTMFRCIPFIKTCNRHVEYLDKRHCNLQSVPDEVLRYTRTLEELLLDSNQLTDLPRGLYRLVELRKLTLSDNEIGRIHPDISNFVNLQELDFSKNDIEDIPENIKLCKNLQVVDFSSNPLTKLPEGFTLLKNLTYLCLNDVSLNRLPNDFGSLSNMENLELRENFIKYLPHSMSLMRKLRILDLGNNLIDELPDMIGSLSNLEELLLDCNEISEIPPEIGKLKRLTQLDLSENKLESLPEEIGGLACLTDLYLSRNLLEQLPDSIGNLHRLCILKVDQNQLLKLTPNIGECQLLQELILTENLLVEITSEVGKLQRLTNLNLDRNRLTSIPPEIGSCSSLGVLSLRDNRISSLPDEIGDLRSLHVLDVAGNRLHHLPVTLGLCSLKAIWLSENQTHPMLQFQEDEDEETGAKVLTCFLLPQLAYQTESMENLLRDSTRNSGTTELENWDAHVPDKPQGAVTTTIVFAGVDGYDSDHDREESRFIRQNTPHPKELRTRHAGKLMKKEGHQAVENVHYELHESRNPDVPKQSEKVIGDCGQVEAIHESPTHPASPASKKSDDSLKSASPGSPETIGEPNMAASHKETPSPIKSLRLPPAQSPAESPPTDHLVPMSLPSTSLSSPSPTSPSPVGRTEVSFNFEGVRTKNPLLSCSDDNVNQNDRQNDREEQKQTDDDIENDDIIERHVGFAPDVDEFRSREGKLRRRDTPHHLKNKRIVSKSDPEEKLRRILAQASGGLQRLSSSEGSERWSPVNSTVKFRVTSESSNDANDNIHNSRLLSHSDVENTTDSDDDDNNNNNEQDEEEDEEDEDTDEKAVRKRLLPQSKNDGRPVNGSKVRLLSCGSQSEDVAKDEDQSWKLSDVDKDSPKSTEVVLRIIRDQALGLGMSVAGGLGSSPYRGQDKGIFVSRVVPGGPAQKAGIMSGDRLISVNGRNTVNVTHLHGVNLLGGAGEEVTVVVSREKFDDEDDAGRHSKEDHGHRPHNVAGAVVVTLVKESPSSGFGFSLVENRNRVVTISKIMPGGIADQDGKLRTRDRIMTVNGVDLSCSGLKKVVSVLSDCKQKATIVVFRNKSSNFSPTRDFQDTPISPTRLRLASLSHDPSSISHPVEPFCPVDQAINSPAVVMSSSPKDFDLSPPSSPNQQESHSTIATVAAISPRSVSSSSTCLPSSFREETKSSQLSGSRTDRNVLPTTGCETAARLGELSAGASEMHGKDLQKQLSMSPPSVSGSSQRFDFLATPTCFIRPVPSLLTGPKPYSKSDFHKAASLSSPTELQDALLISKQLNSPFSSGSKENTNEKVEISGFSALRSVRPIEGNLTENVSKIRNSVTFQSPSSSAEEFGTAGVDREETPLSAMSGSLDISFSPDLVMVHDALPTKAIRDVVEQNSSLETPAGEILNENHKQTTPSQMMSSSSSSSPPPPKIEGAFQYDVEHEDSCAYNLNKTAGMDDQFIRSYPVEKVILKRGEGPLGLSIAGSSRPNPAYGSNVPGVFISRIASEGVASKSPLRIGDRILSVNGADVRNAGHSVVVELLQGSEDVICIEVSRDSTSTGLQEVVLVREPGGKLGMSIRGGHRSKSGNPLDPRDEGIFISKIHPSGIAFKDGRLKVGHRILEVNGQSILGSTHQEAVSILKSSVDNKLTLVVCHGFDSCLLRDDPAADSVPSDKLKSKEDVRVGPVDKMRIDSLSSLDWGCESRPEEKSTEMHSSSASPTVRRPDAVKEIQNLTADFQNPCSEALDEASDGSLSAETMTFLAKKRFFEQEIENSRPNPPSFLARVSPEPRMLSERSSPVSMATQGFSNQ